MPTSSRAGGASPATGGSPRRIPGGARCDTAPRDRRSGHARPGHGRPSRVRVRDHRPAKQPQTGREEQHAGQMPGEVDGTCPPETHVEAGDEREEDELGETPQATQNPVPAGHPDWPATLGDELRCPSKEPSVHERAHKVDPEVRPAPDPVEPSGSTEQDDPDDEEHHPDLGDPGRDAAGDVPGGCVWGGRATVISRRLPSPGGDLKCRCASCRCASQAPSDPSWWG